MSESPVVRAHVLVSGTVQGVGFRYFAYHGARELSLAGWVRNLRTGAVELEVEGADAEVARYLESVKAGPSAAVVRDVQVQWITPTGEHGFALRD